MASAKLARAIALKTHGVDSARNGRNRPGRPDGGVRADHSRCDPLFLVLPQGQRAGKGYDGIENCDIVTPAGRVLRASNWGGTGNPIWFSRDGRIRNCKDGRRHLESGNLQAGTRDPAGLQGSAAVAAWKISSISVVDNLAKAITPEHAAARDAPGLTAPGRHLRGHRQQRRGQEYDDQHWRLLHHRSRCKPTPPAG